MLKILGFFCEDVTFARLARPLTMPVLCLASLSRSLVGVAGGASKVIKGAALLSDTVDPTCQKFPESTFK
jgi:hypothetical protein